MLRPTTDRVSESIFNILAARFEFEVGSIDPKTADASTWPYLAGTVAVGYQPVTSKFSTYSMEFFGDLLKALDEVKEGDGTLLDHSLVLAYTDTGFAKLHTLDNIPMILAGTAGGRIKGGYHIAGEGAPVSRVGLTIQQAFGMSVDSWGTGSLETKKPISEILV